MHGTIGDPYRLSWQSNIHLVLRRSHRRELPRHGERWLDIASFLQLAPSSNSPSLAEAERPIAGLFMILFSANSNTPHVLAERARSSAPDFIGVGGRLPPDLANATPDPTSWQGWSLARPSDVGGDPDARAGAQNNQALRTTLYQDL
jgi:hypothetical protein